MKLAQQRGAHIRRHMEIILLLQISEFARLWRFKVVVGRSSARRRSVFGRQSLTEQLIALFPNLDVYVIPDKNTPAWLQSRAQAQGKTCGAICWRIC